MEREYYCWASTNFVLDKVRRETHLKDKVECLKVKGRGLPEAVWVVLSHGYMDDISRSL